MEDDTTRTWWLGSGDLQDAVAKLGKIRDRAAKHGLSGGLTWRLGQTRMTPVYDDDGATIVINGVPHRLDGMEPRPCPVLYVTEERELVVAGTAPMLDGWRFIATLTWEGEVLITRTVPGFAGRIDDSVIRERACDHCRTDRRRNDCYLLEHVEDRRMQVGASCVKDFLGHDFSPRWITTAADLDEIEEGFGGGGEGQAPVLSVLTWAAAITRRDGWVSRERAETEYRAASVDVLRECLFGRSAKATRNRGEIRQESADTEAAATVLEWAKQIEPGDSEYLANLRRAASAEYLSERNVGVLGSAVAAWHREQRREAERAASADASFLGEPGAKITVTVTLRSDTPVPGDYGVRHRYQFTTSDGDTLVWWSSRDLGLKAGAELQLAGTVKRHEEYQGMKSTVVLRCKVTPAA